MPDTTEDRERPSDQIREARVLVDFADGMAAPADSHADRLATIALGQARATLAVAEEIRALRERLGEGLNGIAEEVSRG